MTDHVNVPIWPIVFDAVRCWSLFILFHILIIVSLIFWKLWIYQVQIWLFHSRLTLRPFQSGIKALIPFQDSPRHKLEVHLQVVISHGANIPWTPLCRKEGHPWVTGSALFWRPLLLHPCRNQSRLLGSCGSASHCHSVSPESCDSNILQVWQGTFWEWILCSLHLALWSLESIYNAETFKYQQIIKIKPDNRFSDNLLSNDKIHLWHDYQGYYVSGDMYNHRIFRRSHDSLNQ